MIMNMEMRLAGSGGQGLIMGSIILAEAAILDHKYAAQSQSYGPEARGGMCKAEVIIRERPIEFPKVEHPDFLLALTPDSWDKYHCDVKPGGTIIADSTVKIPDESYAYKIVQAPIVQTANEAIKKPMTVNIVAVGVINALLGLVSDSALEQAVRMHVPKGTESVNLAALDAGKRLVMDGGYVS